jgi:hypothetical protein
MTYEYLKHAVSPSRTCTFTENSFIPPPPPPHTHTYTQNPTPLSRYVPWELAAKEIATAIGPGTSLDGEFGPSSADPTRLPEFPSVPSGADDASIDSELADALVELELMCVFELQVSRRHTARLCVS